MRISLIYLSILLGVVLTFQNCGKFNAVPPGKSDVSSYAEGDFAFEPNLEPGARLINVFKQNPVVDIGNASLPFNSQLDSYTTTGGIVGLKTGVPQLTGDHIRIFMDGLFPNQLVSPSLDLVRAPNHPYFQQTNTYFHMASLFRHASNQTNVIENFTPVLVDAHCHCPYSNSSCTTPPGQNNAFFDFGNDFLCLGYVNIDDVRVWASDDADVVIHEAGHALNHHYSTDQILDSHPDAVSIDEGLADYWVYAMNNGPGVAEWFGAALNSKYYQTRGPLRDISQPYIYPLDNIGESHNDGLALSSALYELSKEEPLKSSRRQRISFVKNLLESLQAPATMTAVTRLVREQAIALGIATAAVDAALTSRGLLRFDQLTSVSPATISVIDNHSLADLFLLTGNNSQNVNCNGQLDRGEKVLVHVNLLNTGNAIGAIEGKVTTSAPSSEVIIWKDQVGFSHIFKAKSFLKSLPPYTPDSASYQSLNAPAIGRASFVVEALTAAKLQDYSFQLEIKTLSTFDERTSKLVIPFTVRVNAGGSLTTTDCPSGKEVTVWPTAIAQ